MSRCRCHGIIHCRRRARIWYRRFCSPERGARFLSGQTHAGDDVATRILLLAQFLHFLCFFVRLLFLWGLGRFFFGGFLRVLTFTHDFLRLNMAMPSYVIEHSVTGNLVGIAWRRQNRRAARGQAANIQQLRQLNGSFGVDLQTILRTRPATRPVPWQRRRRSGRVDTRTVGASVSVRQTGPGQIVLQPDHVRTSRPTPCRHRSDIACAAQSNCDGYRHTHRKAPGG